MNPRGFKVGDEEVLERVIKLLNYPSLKSFEDDVKTIKDWVSKQPHFPEIMDDKKIQNFLILNKGSLEVTKQKIDNYYTVRGSLPEVYEGINPKLPYLQNTMDTCYMVASMTYSKDLCRVIYIKARNRKLMETLNPLDGLRFMVNSQEMRLVEDVMFGDIIVMDGKDMPLKAILNLTPMVLYKTMVVIYEKVFSSRLKALYFINFSPLVDKLLTVLKVVMKPKLFNRVHVVQNYELLFEELGKEVVPKDYGGAGESLEELQERLRKKLQEYEKYFDKLDQLRVDENRRPEELKNNEILGFHGSFKNLEVD